MQYGDAWAGISDYAKRKARERPPPSAVSVLKAEGRYAVSGADGIVSADRQTLTRMGRYLYAHRLHQVL